jgi:hypothetical protein
VVVQLLPDRHVGLARQCTGVGPLQDDSEAEAGQRHVLMSRPYACRGVDGLLSGRGPGRKDVRSGRLKAR